MRYSSPTVLISLFQHFTKIKSSQSNIQGCIHVIMQITKEVNIQNIFNYRNDPRNIEFTFQINRQW